MIKITSLLAACLCMASSLFAYDTLPASNPLPNSPDSQGSIGIWAEVDEGTPSIKLRFLFEGSFDIYRRVYGTTDWGTALVTNSGTISEWTDNNVTVGTIYEYGVANNPTNNDYGYITAGIRADQANSRGTLILLIAENIIVGNEAKLQRLFADLVGDGWKIKTITTPYFDNSSFAFDNSSSWGLHGHDTVRDIRNQIREIYYANPDEVKMLYFLGHTPLAQSGLSVSHPDGHGSRGPIPTDFYFADMDGIFTDIGTNTNSAAVGAELSLPNVPGDGLFDQNRMPSRLELAIGRVDPFDSSPTVNWYAPDPDKTHAEKIAIYLDKAHSYRHVIPYGLAGSETLPGRRAIVRWNQGGQPGAMYESLEFLPMFGPDQMDDYVNKTAMPTPVNPNDDEDVQYIIENGPYLYYGQNSSGPPDTDIGSTAVHRFSMQSYWGDWWANNSSRKSIFKDTNMTLTWLYTGRFGDEFLNHPLGIGATFGEAMQLTANYEPNEYLTGAFISGAAAEDREFLRDLVGDPTLRLFPVEPISNLTATPNGSDVALAWTAPSDTSELEEYRVYRANDILGDFTMIASGLTATNYTDTSAPAGPKVYMVKAVHLVPTGSGTILNNAQGIFAQVGLSIDTALLPPFPIGEDVNFSLTASGTNGNAVWSLKSGLLPPGMELLADGTIQGNPVSAGHYKIELQVTDDSSLPVSREYSLLVDGAFTEVVNVDLRKNGGLGLYDKTQYDRRFTIVGDPVLEETGGMTFDGVDDYVIVHNMSNDNWPDLSYLPEDGADHGFAFVVSFKADPDGDGGMIFAKVLNMSNTWGVSIAEYAAQVMPDGKVEVRTTNRRVTSTSSVKDGQWHQIAYVAYINEADGKATTGLYVDGVKMTKTSSDGRTPIEEDFLIGARWDDSDAATTDHFEGTIADFRIYRTGIEAGEAKALYEKFTRSRTDITPHAPVFSGLPADHFVDTETDGLSGSIPFNIIDADGEPLKTYIIAEDPDAFEYTEIASTATGYELRFQLKPDISGGTKVLLAADDGWPGQTTTQEIEIKVAGAGDDNFTSPLEPTVFDPLANDIPVPGNTLALTEITTQPTRGYVKLIGNTIKFFPPPMWNEPVSFTYTITASPSGNTSVGTITISPTNLPTPANDSYDIGAFDPTLLDVLANDTDPLSETLTLVRVDQPDRGSVRILNGQVQYTAPGTAGDVQESFTYYVRNETGFTQSATVAIALSTFGLGTPVAEYLFDEGSGTTADNIGSIGDAADGTTMGSPAWVAGTSGTAIAFDGINDYVSLGNPAGLSFDPASDSFTIMADVRIIASPIIHTKNYTIISKETGPGAQSQFAVALGFPPGQSGGSAAASVLLYIGDQVIVSKDTTPDAYLYYERPYYWRYINVDGDYNDSDWRLVTVIYDAELDILRIFVDEFMIVYLDTSGMNLSQADNGAPVIIGARADGSGGMTDFLEGAIDNVRIYDRAIQTKEIKPHLSRIGIPSDNLMPTPIGMTPSSANILAVNETVTLSPIFEDPDTDDSDIIVTWYKYSPSNAFSSSVSQTLEFTPDELGNWEIYYRITQTGETGSRSSTSGTFIYNVAANAVSADELIITSPKTLPSFVNGGVTDRSIGVSGGTPPYTFNLTQGALPTGIQLDANTGALTGTTTQQGLHTFRIRVTDNAGAKVDQAFRVSVLPPDSDDDRLPDDWEMRYPDMLGATPDGDGDGDGIKTKVEFILVGNPDGYDRQFIALSETRGIITNNDDRYTVIKYKRRRDLADFTLKLMMSTNFIDWTQADLEETVLEDDGEMQTIEMRVPNAGRPMTIYRLAVD